MNSKYIKQVFISLALLSYMAFSGAVETITYFHNDALGSPVAATDESGNVLWREAYKPYGSRIRKEDNGTNDTWFTGKQEDKDTGLSYFGARWYDPVIGRFMGIDPVGFQEDNIHSFNRYAYVNNNPYKYVDPDGRVAKEIILGIIGYSAKKCGQSAGCSKAVIKFFTKATKKQLKGKKTKHIDNRHVDRKKEDWVDKSKFKKPNQIEKINSRTVKKPDRVIEQRNNKIRFEKDFGRDIGTKGERTNVTVINKVTGKRVTQFPIK